MIIGLTGGIGAGKSVVSRILRCNGYEVYDCDSKAKKLMVYDDNIKNEIINCLGNEAYTDKGELNRAFISSKIFSQAILRNKINYIVHKGVREDFRRHIKGEEIIFIESAILWTGGLTEYCDEIWLIEAPIEVKIRRLERRDNLSRSAILQRIESQEKEVEKLSEEKIIKILKL